MKEATSGLVVFDTEMLQDREYWLNRLADDLTIANINLDFERSDIPFSYRRELDIRVSDACFEKLKALTASGSFLIYTSLLSAMQICLYKYTGNPVIAIGS